MADYINKRAFTREYDFREKIKKTMVGFTQYFLKDVAATDDPLYYASLYDMWAYSVNAERLAGSAISFGLVPQLNYLHFKDENSDSNDLKFSLLALIKYQFHKALGLDWQFDFESQLKGGFMDIYHLLNGEEVEDDVKYAFIPSLSIGFGFYPTTRTSVISKFRIAANMLQPTLDDEIVNARAIFSWQNNINYYISPRIRMYGYLNLGKPDITLTFATNKNIERTVFRFNGSFGTGISYSVY